MLSSLQTPLGIIEMTQVGGRDDDQLNLVILKHLLQSVDDLEILDSCEISSGRFLGGS
jgi:hypothetical protein